MKRCAKCFCPLVEAQLATHEPELCEHCGDYDEMTKAHWNSRLARWGKPSCGYGGVPA